MKKPLILCILDGCGLRKEEYGNAFTNANTPNFDYLCKNYPFTSLDASGEKVGLPKNQMGNSEVGHMNIGAGRIVYSPLEIINKSIKSKEFYKNDNILEVINHIKKNNSKLHIMGLISDGGVQSHINHLFALIDMCKKENVKDLCFHLFTDGRDTKIKSGKHFVKSLEEKINNDKTYKICTISGRYYAMDRDNNYDRIKLSYDTITRGVGKKFKTVDNLFDYYYEKGITDEFINPSIINEIFLEDNDGIIIFNFRSDRIRELMTVITNPKFDKIKTKKLSNIKTVSMMPISDEVIGCSAFDNPILKNTLGEYISNLGLNQLRIAETEKYAHVTYFFDGGKHLNLKNSKKILINSKKVSTYDLKPEMSANEITDKLLEELDRDYLDFVILNFANGDMVGHTGVYEAAKIAVETLDKCIGRIYKKVLEKKGILIITADHGNCDVMINKDGSICTTHTTNKVPFIITKKDITLKDNGKLADIAPSILKLLDLEIPKEFEGDSLIL